MTQLNSIPELELEVKRMLELLTPGADSATVVTLSGGLGAGKTTFAKILAKQLAVDEDVTSPTFVIERIYQLPAGQKFARLIHIDAYRLASAHDLEVLGWKDVIKDPSNLILVEWPEMVEGAIPDGAIRVKIEWISETERDITILQDARVQ